MLIDAVIFHKDDGTIEHVGGHGGHLSSTTFVLQAGEYLKEIQQKTGDSLDAIKFITNTGRQSIKYGGNGGSWKERDILTAPAGQRISSVNLPDYGFCPVIDSITTYSTNFD